MTKTIWQKLYDKNYMAKTLLQKLYYKNFITKLDNKKYIKSQMYKTT